MIPGSKFGRSKNSTLVGGTCPYTPYKGVPSPGFVHIFIYLSSLSDGPCSFDLCRKIVRKKLHSNTYKQMNEIVGPSLPVPSAGEFLRM